ncbi:MAG: beta-ketoacyl synthase N-terminal-like domain-containing protein [Chloroflexota bacterium]|nr:beta-ketoacyl synthase N-terminal-like domain-containing protein [Chloroflexota bacterium]
MVSAGAYRGMTEEGQGDPRRVVITGLGAVTAAGSALSDYWSAVCEGRVCVSQLSAFDAHRPAAAGQIPDGWQDVLGAPDWLLARMDRASQLALAAAIQAQTDARIVFNEQNAFAVGAVTGTAHPNAGQGFAALGSGLSGASVGLNIAGPVFTVSMGGASGLASVVLASQTIRSGISRAAIAIGAEAPLRQDVWSAYESAGLLDSSDDPMAHRPFDANRQGMILGEGAAALMLEDRQLATQRGVHIYAEIAGEALTSGPMGDGLAPTDVEIARRATGDALLSGEIAPADIDVIVTAGVGSKLGDERETDVIERAFGRRTLDMYATALTPNVGYTIGASGALSAVSAALIVDQRKIPPHATYREPDIACKLGIVSRLYEDRIVGAATAAYGAHGQNAALILMPHRAEAGDELPLLVN